MASDHHYSIEELRDLFAKADDKMFVDALLKGVLKLTDEDILTILFVFGMVHRAELDIEAWIIEPYKVLDARFPPEVMDKVRGYVNGFLQKQEPKAHLNDMDSFGKKINIYEYFFHPNNVSTVLRELKRLRDDLSHLRIRDLRYKGKSLTDRKTKEELFFDYMEAVTNPDHSKSLLTEGLQIPLGEDSRVRQILLGARA